MQDQTMLHRLVAVGLALSLLPGVHAICAADQVVVGANNAVVVSGHPDATRLGLEVLRQGGNAIDALVSVSTALGVTEPGNSGLGGKLVVIYHEASTKKTHALIALGAAPLNLDVDRIVAMPVAQRRRGWASVCTPGLIAGLEAAHQKWGSRPWASLLEPVAALSEEGFELSDRAAEMMSEFQGNIDPEAARIYLPGGKPLQAGDRLRNEDLAATLRLIARDGAKVMYGGPIAEKIVAASKKAGGFLSIDDFREYQPRFLDPVQADYRGYSAFSSPPPLTGGSTVLLALRCLERMDWPAGRPRDAQYIDTVARVLQQIYPEISRVAGDVPDARVRLQRLFADASIDKLVANARRASPPSPYEPAAHLDDAVMDDHAHASTTHLIVVDRFGNIACATQSLSLHFGALVVAPGTGILMNNDMTNFGFNVRSSVNMVAPGKMPRSTMSPTIVLRDGKPVVAIGSPAGQRIPVQVLQVLLDRLDHARDINEAIQAPRFHLRRPMSSSEAPNVIDIEALTPESVEQELRDRQWQVERRGDQGYYFGSVMAVIWNEDGSMSAAADSRRTAAAGGD
jgi:gamma-glutamyltranspeptidase / glutathione hydrolase